MKHLFYLLTIFILALSCSVDKEEEEFDSFKNEFLKTESDLIKFNDPSVFVGTDFGNYFQSMLERGEYEQMLMFTSSKSIKNFGRDVVLEFYMGDEIDFGYELGSLKSKKDYDSLIVLTYPNAIIMAEKTIIRINVVIENDSCKILLPNDLKKFPS